MPSVFSSLCCVVFCFCCTLSFPSPLTYLTASSIICTWTCLMGVDCIWFHTIDTNYCVMIHSHMVCVGKPRITGNKWKWVKHTNTTPYNWCITPTSTPNNWCITGSNPGCLYMLIGCFRRQWPSGCTGGGPSTPSDWSTGTAPSSTTSPAPTTTTSHVSRRPE